MNNLKKQKQAHAIAVKKYRSKNPSKDVKISFYPTNSEDMLVYLKLCEVSSKKQYIKDLILKDLGEIK